MCPSPIKASQLTFVFAESRRGGAGGLSSSLALSFAPCALSVETHVCMSQSIALIGRSKTPFLLLLTSRHFSGYERPGFELIDRFDRGACQPSKALLQLPFNFEREQRPPQKKSACQVEAGHTKHAHGAAAGRTRRPRTPRSPRPHERDGWRAARRGPLGGHLG